MRAVNLIPAEQRGGAPVGAGKSGGVAFAVLGLLAAVAVLAVLYGVAQHQVSSRKAQAASIEAKASQEQAVAAQLAPYTSFIALHQARAQAVESLVDSRFDWAHTFHEFGRVLPTDASLASLSGSIGAAPRTASTSAAASGASSAASASNSATPPGSVPSFTITGCATSQDAVAETIDRLRLIDGVSAVSLVSSTKPSGGGAGSGAGGCENAPAFALQVNFQPLPATSAAAAAATTRTVANTSGTGTKSSATASSSTSTGGLR